MSFFLGIDTSNYTTSAALFDENELVKSVQYKLKVKEGERGLRQSDAVFQHTVNLPKAMEEIGAVSCLEAVSYSAYPRDAEGSYMPCFLCGEAAARSIAAVCGVKLYAFSHQAGHVAAAIYSSGAKFLNETEFLSFHVSGGTTELLHVAAGGKITLLGGTLDLNAGQAIDRAGVMMGLSFPCGPELEKLAQGCRPYGKPAVCVNGFGCNLSGIENKVGGMLKKGVPHGEIAAYVIESVKLTLAKLTDNALAQYPNLPVLFAGGVTGNKLIRSYMTEHYQSYFAEPQFAADNAAGTALLGRRKYYEDLVNEFCN